MSSLPPLVSRVVASQNSERQPPCGVPVRCEERRKGDGAPCTVFWGCPWEWQFPFPEAPG